nr:rRNA maturation RNase YbeY [Holospora curviuscula]
MRPVLHLTLDSRKNFLSWYTFFDQSFVENILNSTLLIAGHDQQSDISVEVLLISDEEMKYYTENYGPEPGPTNVLSFPLFSFEEILSFPKTIPLPLGSILLGVPYIMQEIENFCLKAEAHWARLLIHGMLHLLGYDHVEPKERTTMETLEAKICTHLGYYWRPL